MENRIEKNIYCKLAVETNTCFDEEAEKEIRDEFSNSIRSLVGSIVDDDRETFDDIISHIDNVIDLKIMHLLQLKSAFDKITFDENEIRIKEKWTD